MNLRVYKTPSLSVFSVSLLLDHRVRSYRKYYSDNYASILSEALYSVNRRGRQPKSVMLESFLTKFFHYACVLFHI